MDATTFLCEFVEPARPCVLRGILPKGQPSLPSTVRMGEREFAFSEDCSSTCGTETFLGLFAAGQRQCSVYGCHNTQGSPVHRIQCAHKFLGDIVSHKGVQFKPDVRFWEHKPGHYTRAHYDANLVHVLNFCLAGSKRFFVAAPGSRAVWPLTNICVKGRLTGSDVKVFTVYPGDAIYLPARWLHAVETTKPTINADLRFYANTPPSPQVLASREFALVALHGHWNTAFLRSCAHLPASYWETPSAIPMFLSEFAVPLVVVGLAPLALLLRGWYVVTALLALLVGAGFCYTHTNAQLHGGLLTLHANAVLVAFCFGIALALLVTPRQRHRRVPY